MFRAFIELLITILIVLVARAVLTSLFKGIANASASAFRNGNPQFTAQRPANSPPASPAGGDLHKDPVCGTYVAESTPFRQHISGQTFYYCSDACREKHALVAH
jgi:YHS domain-containing protein